MPLARAFVLYAAICARHDVKMKGPNYTERQILKAMSAVETEVLP